MVDFLAGLPKHDTKPCMYIAMSPKVTGIFKKSHHQFLKILPIYLFHTTSAMEPQVCIDQWGGTVRCPWIPLIRSQHTMCKGFRWPSQAIITLASYCLKLSDKSVCLSTISWKSV